MQEFNNFIRNYIRSKRYDYSWLDQKSLELSELLKRLKYLLDARAIIILCDKEREWYLHYLTNLLNSSKNNRPLLPIFSLRDFYSATSNEDLINDLFSLSFQNGHTYIYFGKDNDKLAKIAKNKNDSILFIFDEEYSNAFYLNSKDENLDIKLISLANLMNACLDAIVFNKVNI